MFITAETGMLINLDQMQVIAFRQQEDRRAGGYTHKYEVITKAANKDYVIQTVTSKGEALDVIDSIKCCMNNTGTTILTLPEDIPF